jgi:hypothetical protein
VRSTLCTPYFTAFGSFVCIPHTADAMSALQNIVALLAAAPNSGRKLQVLPQCSPIDMNDPCRRTCPDGEDSHTQPQVVQRVIYLQMVGVRLTSPSFVLSRVCVSYLFSPRWCIRRHLRLEWIQASRATWLLPCAGPYAE